ncbi:MAG: hypothetical protein IJB38_08950 [Bacteroidales bacterium]|nr:hypothetical protein [Bacteroidales bacterium]
MTRGKVRCPIGVGHDNEMVGHDKEEKVEHDERGGSAWYHIVIAGLTGNLEGKRCPIGVGHDEERGSGMTEKRKGHGTISSLPA